MNSLERSLQIGLIGAIVVVMFVFWWTVTLTSRMLTESYVFTQLEKQAYRVNATASADTRSVIDVANSMFTMYPERVYIFANDNSTTITPHSVVSANLPVPALRPGESLRQGDVGQDGQRLLAWYGGFSQAGEPFVLGVVQNVESIWNKLRVFQWFAGTLAVLLLGVVLTVQRIIVRRSVEKLEGIRRDMLRLEHGQAVALAEDVPSEIMPLVVEFNQLLRRFEQRLRQSRNSVGNLAHSLKGPLNLLIRCSENAVIGPSERTAIAQNTEHIRRLIESELKRARLAGRGAVAIRFDAGAELPALIGLLEQVYSEKNAKVSFKVGQDVELLHDRQDMLELIGNLLDNAVKWCETRVLLNIKSESGVVIEVEDDGPGCSPEVLGQLTGRGVRLDESVSGHGLGLSIVKDIVDTYDGRLELDRSRALGGLKATVFLPGRR